MEVIILAGGKGTRLRSLISDRPKPLAPVNGKAFLELIMEYFLLQGCQHFIVSVGYKRNMIIDHLGDKFHGVPVTFAEELNPLGTGGALLNAYSYLRSEQPFLVANGDTYFNINLKEFRKELIALNGDVNIALFKAPEVNRYGRVLLDEKRVVKFGFDEKRSSMILRTVGFSLKRDALFGLAKGARLLI